MPAVGADVTTGTSAGTADVTSAEAADEGRDKVERPADSRVTGRSPNPPRRHGKRWLLPVAAVIVVLVVIAAFAVGSDSSKPKGTQSVVPAPPTYVTFRDVGTAGTGLSISYPSTWTKDLPPDSITRLLLRFNGPFDSLKIKSQPVEGVIDTSNIADIKAFTDAAISGPTIKVLENRPLNVNGQIGYYYLYYFTDPGSGQTLAHAHYFLFRGHDMNILVFQATISDFQALATTFDRVVQTFQGGPGTSPPASTNAPPATAAP